MRRTTRISAILAIVVLSLVVALPLSAEGVTSVKVLGSDIPEFKVEGAYTYTIDMLQGEGMLTQGNNLKVKTVLGVSPIASTLSVDAVLTPLAVAELSLGGAVGTGWDFSPLGNEGLRIGASNDTDTYVSDSLGGAYLKARAGAALQFDTGAVFEGEWKSVLMRTYQEMSYQMYTGADSDDWWEYEASGARTNDFEYRAEYVVGYRVPLVVNLVALMLEVETRGLTLDTPQDTTYVLGLPVNMSFDWGLDVTLIPQINLHEEGADIYKRVAAMATYTF
ncbi:MAG: hypothetical protein JXK93_13640 [Sphaerochaetaceae bacterium]|nr:hypothetical protein [Sphaerochaetaceae bacterium]